jgi:hypothetical protein
MSHWHFGAEAISYATAADRGTGLDVGDRTLPPRRDRYTLHQTLVASA